jgi:hypothetical protein
MSEAEAPYEKANLTPRLTGLPMSFESRIAIAVGKRCAHVRRMASADH